MDSASASKEGVSVDIARSALRALDGLVRAVPAILGQHRRLAAYVAALESREPTKSLLAQIRHA